MAIWHPTIEAFEVHGSRVEHWNSRDPYVTVTLAVPHGRMYEFVHGLVMGRLPFPKEYGNNCEQDMLWALFVADVQIHPIAAKYADIESEIMTAVSAEQLRLVTVTYRSNTAYPKTLDSSTGSGTQDPGSGSFASVQTVWVEQQRVHETEFLTLDFNEFQWRDANGKVYPLKSADEAAGHRLHSVRYVRTYFNVRLTDDIENILYNYNQTVNENPLESPWDMLTFQPEQVKMTIHSVTPSLRKCRMLLSEQLHDLRIDFNVRLGEGTWNKFYRAASAGGVQVSGWYELYHKPSPGNPAVQRKPFPVTDAWEFLW